MTFAFDVKNLSVEGTLTAMPEVIHDTATFAPSSGGAPPDCNQQNCQESMSPPMPPNSVVRDSLHNHVEAIGDGKILAGLLQLIELLKQFGLIK